MKISSLYYFYFLLHFISNKIIVNRASFELNKVIGVVIHKAQGIEVASTFDSKYKK